MPFDQQARYSNRSAQSRRRGDAGNSLGTARRIPTTIGSREFRDSVSSADADFYRFRLKKPMSVRIKAANLSGDALAFTVTRQGGAIFAQAPAINAGQQNRDPRLKLRPGTYFIRIESISPNLSSYRLTVDIKKPPRGSSGGGGGWFDNGFGDGNFVGGGGFGGFTCSDFSSQAEAQAYLAANSSLDGDGDGIPCESLPAW